MANVSKSPKSSAKSKPAKATRNGKKAAPKKAAVTLRGLHDRVSVLEATPALGGMLPLLAAAPAPQNVAHGLPPAPYQHLGQQNAATRIKAIMGAQLHVDPSSISNNDFVLQPGIFAGALLPALNTHFFAPPIPVALAGFVPGERVAALATRINATRDPHIP